MYPCGGDALVGEACEDDGGREGTLHFLLNFAMNLLDFFFKAKERTLMLETINIVTGK